MDAPQEHGGGFFVRPGFRQFSDPRIDTVQGEVAVVNLLEGAILIGVAIQGFHVSVTLFTRRGIGRKPLRRRFLRNTLKRQYYRKNPRDISRHL